MRGVGLPSAFDTAMLIVAIVPLEIGLGAVKRSWKRASLSRRATRLDTPR